MDKVANSKKILSVSIASYNVEKFLDQTLESCLVPEIMDRLEVIIVNDGSKDGTADVAKKYTEKWPDTFILVDKENGGYGSTVNVGIKTATGKYFRLLDGDDWFDKDGLREFIGILEQAQEDMVIARFRRVFESDGHTEERDEGENVPFVTGTFDELPDKAWFTMHAITYRTSLLKENNVTITEHCFYTDQEYDLLPLRWVNTVRIAPVTVYCYRIGRGEQSVSIAGLEKHYNEQTIVLKKLYNVYSDVHKRQNKKDNYIYKYFVKRTRFQIRTYLVISKSEQHKKELVDFMNYLKAQQPDIYGDLLKQSKFVKLLVWSNFAAYGALHFLMLKKYRY
ncbi:MAG: glycosyltransferase family 2 protein [Clostridia bacterium]|nr:glycosyltransferase family 2 protein [Clostridia bacterium]